MQQYKFETKARWVAPAKRMLRDPLPIEISYFKTVVNFDTVPKSYEIVVTANARYCLMINGTSILDGPCKGDHYHHYCDKIDIAPYIITGKNIIAAKVIAFPDFGSVEENMANSGPFSVNGNSFGPMLYVSSHLSPDISTGISQWFCMNDTAVSWSIEGIPLLAGGNEIVNGELLPHGWQNDNKISGSFLPVADRWENEANCGEILPLPMYERPIPYMIRQELKDINALKNCKQDAVFIEDSYTKFDSGKQYEITLDAGQLTTAYVLIKMRGGRGSTIKIGYAEAFGENTPLVWMIKHKRDDATKKFLGVFDEYRPSGGEDIYQPFWFRTFRFLRLTINVGDQDLYMYAPKLTETRYPLLATLEFDVPALPWAKQVYNISLRTLQLCMHETYEDCPFYEQLQYIMDTRLQILFTYCVSNDTRMARRTIEDFHSSMLPEGISQSRYPCTRRQIIPQFSLHWILMLIDYYKQTGDLNILQQYRPTVEQILFWFKSKTGKTGMIEKLGYWEFIDWTTEWNPAGGVPDAVAKGPSSINNMFYAYVLQQSTEIFDALGLYNLGADYSQQAKDIINVTTRLCWDNGKQMYREGPDCEQFSQHAQLYAVLNGAVIGSAAKRLIKETLADKTLVKCSFVMQYYLFRALEQCGEYDMTQSMWKPWCDLIENNLTTVPEVPGEITRSDCHAWGALALFEFPAKWFGLSAIEPNFKTIKIEPKAEFIGNFTASMPTPQGTVKLCAHWENGMMELSGYTPVRANIILPSGEQFWFEAGDFCTKLGMQ